MLKRKLNRIVCGDEQVVDRIVKAREAGRGAKLARMMSRRWEERREKRRLAIFMREIFKSMRLKRVLKNCLQCCWP